MFKGWKLGLVAGESLHSRAVVESCRAKVSQAADLTDLAKEYRFFTPALMYLRIRLMGVDPFHDFLAEYAANHSFTVVPIVLTFDQPIFRGLELSSLRIWNHCLLGMRHTEYTAFEQWLGTLAFNDRELRRLTRLRYRDLDIVDPLFLLKQTVLPASLPRVRITAVCLDSTDGCWYVAPPSGPLDLPEARYSSQTFDETLKFAQAIASESENPYADMEAALASDDLSVPEQEIRDRVREARKEQQQ